MDGELAVGFGELDAQRIGVIGLGLGDAAGGDAGGVCGVTVVTGDPICVQVGAVAAIGDAVFVDNATGAITTGAGAAPAGAVDTGWKVIANDGGQTLDGTGYFIAIKK